jgi:predicted nucleic acid-binding protein
VDAFDADVLIFAADPANALGQRVRLLFPDTEEEGEDEPRVGSTILIPEVLSKPIRDNSASLGTLEGLLARIDLRPTTLEVAKLAAQLGSTYRLRAADAVHLATAVEVGADRFITNNQRDFPKTIEEIAVTYPEDLPEVAAS